MGKVSVQRVVLPTIHPFNHPCIHSFNKYVLSTFKMPEAILRIRNIVWKKKKNFSHPHGAQCPENPHPNH